MKIRDCHCGRVPALINEGMFHNEGIFNNEEIFCNEKYFIKTK
ncbi:hypothetical protein CLOM621_07382 [Clostridium sp. M62/1]|nr:hypothetical protein CLOM621_07382 [Clostridium sp. M62/1]